MLVCVVAQHDIDFGLEIKEVSGVAAQEVEELVIVVGMQSGFHFHGFGDAHQGLFDGEIREIGAGAQVVAAAMLLAADMQKRREPADVNRFADDVSAGFVFCG